MKILFEGRLWFSLLLALLFLAVSTGSSEAGEKMGGKLNSLIDALEPDAELSVIVSLSEEADLSAFKDEKVKSKRRTAIVKELMSTALLSQAPTGKFLRDRGAKRIKSLWITNAMAVTATAGTLKALEKRPGVSRIKLDATIDAPVTTTGVAAAPEWNIGAVRAPELWALGESGYGVVVANMDTGVDINHTDLLSRWRGGTNSWFDPYGQHATPGDTNGHGTQSMGIMVGGSAGGSAIGMAPDATWIAVKIFNDAGQASLSAIHQGFQWLLDPDGDPLTDDAPDVVNNSWTFQNINDCDPEFSADIAALKASSVMVLFAAGNYGPLPLTSVSPANNPEAFAVGAVDNTLTIADFSSRGPSCDASLYPEVAAPGVNVRTSDRTLGGVFPDSYVVVSGTSFASPHAAGGAALLIGAFPWASVDELESVLKQSPLGLEVNGIDNNYGYGVIDLIESYTLLSGLSSSDSDADGFAYFNDCNDLDPSIHPGATELKHDGIDQDCNGYDLTIDIVKADYNAKKDALSVEATSSLGASAALELTGFAPMSWSARKAKWTVTVKPAGGDPGSVNISGPEGSETASVPLGSSDGGGDGGGGDGGGGGGGGGGKGGGKGKK